MVGYWLTLRKNWSVALDNTIFWKKIIIVYFALLGAIGCLPSFFQYIETRGGYQLNDWLLKKVPSVNLSVLILALIWFSAFIALITALYKPYLLLTLLYGYLLLLIFRYVSIILLPLEPREGLISLADPLSNLAYGNTFITKDLFFRGHTSTVFLIYLCLEERSSKHFTLFAATTVGILLLFQHVHYTIDVLSAPIFAYAVFRLAKKIGGNPQEFKAIPEKISISKTY